MAGDWYPQRLADRIPWHANVDTNAQATGTAQGLSAAMKTSIGKDKLVVPIVVNFKEGVEAYAQAVTEWADLILNGPLGTPFPAVPTAPTVPTFEGGDEAAIQPRHRQYRGIVTAHPLYTAEVGENYGYIAPEAPPAGVPSLQATALTASQVRLAVAKAGYSVVAIDSRRAGGAWEQIGVSMTAEYIDARPPLVAGQPELREYRAQGMENNARVGALSAVVSAVTVP